MDYPYNIVIIDGQGGGMGKQIVEAVKASGVNAEITAVGTNSAATAAMLKAGADKAATGENAVIVASRNADIIVGPLGIVVADSLLGEISPAMAAAVGQSRAKKILIPVNLCSNIIVGVSDMSLAKMLSFVVDAIIELTDTKK